MNKTTRFFKIAALGVLAAFAVSCSHGGSKDKAAETSTAAGNEVAPLAAAVEASKAEAPKVEKKMTKVQAKTACKQQGKKGKELKKCVKEMVL